MHLFPRLFTPTVFTAGLTCIAMADTAPTPPASAPSRQFPLLTASLVVTGEHWTNLRGGTATGDRWNALADLGVTLRLDPGACLIAQVLWVKNQDEAATISTLTGASNPVSGLHAGDQLRVFNLHYRQSWHDDAHVLKIGQLAADCDFMGSDYAGLFANAAFGAMPSQVATPLAASANNTPAFPIYAVAAPGLHFAAKTSASFSWQLGVYHGGPGPDEKRNHGFDWESGAGTVAFIETAWTGKPAGHASALRCGLTAHTGRFDNFSALNKGESAATVRGLSSFYIGHDFVFVADAKDKPVFAAFWRAGLSPQQDRNVVRTYADAGLNWFGPLRSRPGDIAGAAVAYTEFGRAYRAYSGTGPLAHHETTVELTYRAQLTATWAVQADLQLLGKPATGARRTATVAGLRTEHSF